MIQVSKLLSHGCDDTRLTSFLDLDVIRQGGIYLGGKGIDEKEKRSNSCNPSRWG